MSTRRTGWIRPSMGSPLGPSILEEDVLTFGIAEIAEPLFQWPPRQITEETYPEDALRLGGERHGEEGGRPS